MLFQIISPVQFRKHKGGKREEKGEKRKIGILNYLIDCVDKSKHSFHFSHLISAQKKIIKHNKRPETIAPYFKETNNKTDFYFRLHITIRNFYFLI